jgi:ATP-binding cassette subfamily B protein
MTSNPASLKSKALLNQLPYLPRAVALVWQAARPWTLAWLALLLIQGLLPIAAVTLTRVLVDSLVAALDGGPLQPTLTWVGLLALTLLAGEIMNSLSTWVRAAQSERVSNHIYGLIHAQALRLDLAFFETPAFYDQLHRARVDALNRPAALLENLGALAQNGITLVAMAAVLLSFGPWTPLLLLVSTLPALFVVARHTLRFHRWRVRNTVNERRARYYDWILTWHEAAAELRLFGLGDHFKAAFQSLHARLASERVQLARDQAFAELAAGGVALLSMGAALGWMVWQAVRGLASLGDVALFYQAFNQGQRLLRSLLASAGEIYHNLFFLENLFEFLALEPQVPDPAAETSRPARIGGDIHIENVRFQYPDSARVALDDFDLTLPAGQIVALVGENGAGKSTLIKLLCRFYDPQSGRITFDGADARELALADLRRQITVLFQEPVHYHERVSDNIGYGDLEAEPNLEQIEAAARAAGADSAIRTLPQGYQTVLGKWFGGAELSVGEWQRVALARAFLRQASLIILDEPTSAMDSWAEADWLARFRDLVDGRTALIVTHRFTTAMQADVIHVMAAGRVVESGSHAELMALGGRYAQSWRRQTREQGF